MIQHFDRNVAGRDFVVGDIHGCFAKVEDKLREIDFDETRDRLSSVGDLVDRGPDSEDSVDWLNKPWFHAVRGNHEQMAIDGAAGFMDPRVYVTNGGAWFLALPQEHRQYYADAFSCMPLGIDIDFPRGLVGIVHADCPHATWADFRAAVHDGSQIEAIGNMAMWSRDRVTHERDHGIRDLVELIVGHTPVQRMTTLGNVRFIDTGAVFNRDLTVINMTEMFA